MSLRKGSLAYRTVGVFFPWPNDSGQMSILRRTISAPHMSAEGFKCSETGSPHQTPQLVSDLGTLREDGGTIGTG